jgi:hypothetical protein
VKKRRRELLERIEHELEMARKRYRGSKDAARAGFEFGNGAQKYWDELTECIDLVQELLAQEKGDA